MTPQDQVLENIERIGQLENWSGWRIRFVQAGATLLSDDFPGFSDPNISDAELIQLSQGLSHELLDQQQSA